MNWDIVEGNWRQFKDLVKTQGNECAHDRREAIDGKLGELVGKSHKASSQTEGTLKNEEVSPEGWCTLWTKKS